jgi:hypothetical protein
VVAAGEAEGEQLAALERPVAGAHAHVAPPEPESGVAAPAQISAVPPATAVGRGLTVTRALPDAVPAQLASETALTAKVVVEAGLTERVAGETATPFWVTPSDQVRFHGPVPVRAAEIVVAPPAQIAAPPETVAVGSGRTVAVVVPAVDVQELVVTVTL